jgi:uncharacterized protein YaiI (UPF0178 family)
MTVLIDADACPVTRMAESISKAHSMIRYNKLRKKE